jgi:hypothetical protein
MLNVAVRQPDVEKLKGAEGARIVCLDTIAELQKEKHGTRQITLTARDGNIVFAEVMQTSKFKLD